jgi:murein DD-endopeptidase MepM/ murein hydrolase activator NlpD
VQGDYSYSDDFGAARHQGSHEGTDIMADRGTPLVAVTAGVVKRLTRTETGLGGLYVWLQRADGTEYYYAHMNAIADGLQEGQKVAAGQVIGTVGNTGDARYGATHLHFEIRPAGSSPINPYSHLVAVDPTARTQARRG